MTRNMAIRVYYEDSPTGRSQYYPKASAYGVDPEHELDLFDKDGNRVATWAPGSWSHVEVEDR